MSWILHLLERHYREDLKSRFQEQGVFILSFTTEIQGIIQRYVLVLLLFLLYQKLKI